MGYALLVLCGEAASGFLVLDLFFRYMDVRALPHRAWQYGAVAVLFCGAGIWGSWVAGHLPGLLLAAPGPLIWWMLWRFGLRKQLTYLFKDDGGRPLDAERPDP